MEIEGVLEDIIYFNEDNGYSVLEFSVEGRPLTVTGNLPRLSEGQRARFSGEFVTHVKFGRQFAVKELLSAAVPTDLSDITRYLASGLIKGIGPALAARIVERFGADTLNVIENQPGELKKVRGLSIRKALDITNAYNDIKRMQGQIMFLQKLDVSTNLAMKIYSVYKQRTREVIEKNPYKLIDDVDGIGFLTADKLAVKMGVEKNSLFRLRAGLVYVLKQDGETAGNTYLPFDLLVKKTDKLLLCGAEFITENIDGILESLMLEALVKVIELDGARCVVLKRYYDMEVSVAANLTRLKYEADITPRDYAADIAEFESANKIVLHANQKKAVESAAGSGVAVISGGPGTGKTTILKCVLSILKKQRKKVELVSPTGRASKRLSEATGEEAKTVHRLLALDFKDEKPKFTFNPDNPLDCDCVIVDEVSMMDVFLLYSLLRALKRGARIIFVGDKDQLPSVGAGNIISDIIGSGVINTAMLTYIYRQAQESLIVENAHLINAGKMPKLVNDGTGDFFFSAKHTPEEVLETAVQMTAERLPKFAGCDPKNIQVLAPLKNGVAGVVNINKRLQDKLNPAAKDKPEINDYGTVYRTGDKVMQTVNNYELEWKRFSENGTERGFGVFNGDIGFIKSIDRDTGEAEVEFEDNRVITYSQPYFKELMLAYAVTIHKSQGSEFDTVVIPLVSGPYTILSRNLLYTAVTRAKKVALIIGSRETVAAVVRNDYTAKRYTLLSVFLKDQDAKYAAFAAENLGKE